MDPSKINLPLAELLKRQKEDILRLPASVHTSSAELLEKFTNGLNIDSQTIGYHGTSLQAVKILLETGYLPTGRSPKNEGALYCFRNPNHHSKALQLPHSGFATPAAAIALSKVYADTLSSADFLIDFFGVNRSLPSLVNRVTVLTTYKEISDDLRGMVGKRLTDRQLGEVGRYAEDTFKGVILSIAAELPVAISQGDDHQDLRIECPGGLPARYVTGIEPVGEAEFEFFERLQESAAWLGFRAP